MAFGKVVGAVETFLPVWYIGALGVNGLELALA